jgi:lysozyme
MPAPNNAGIEEPKASGKGPLVALLGAACCAVLVPTVQRWEGKENAPYRDIVGVWTVCYGDTKNVKPGDRQSDAQCLGRLERQLLAHAKPVLACVPQLKGKPNAAAASVSLAYNVGVTAFCRSTVAKRLRAGDMANACNAFLMWNKAGGRAVKGLTRRRHAEREICLKDA